MALRPAIFDCHVLPLNKASFHEALSEPSHERSSLLWRLDMHEANHGHGRLLRPRRERPHGCRAAEQRDELASFHSITSSARASNAGGTSSPSARAVTRLMTNSNLVGCSTGRSAGLAPLST